MNGHEDAREFGMGRRIQAMFADLLRTYGCYGRDS